jgi:hypothetical protein
MSESGGIVIAWTGSASRASIITERDIDSSGTAWPEACSNPYGDHDSGLANKAEATSKKGSISSEKTAAVAGVGQALRIQPEASDNPNQRLSSIWRGEHREGTR